MRTLVLQIICTYLVQCTNQELKYECNTGMAEGLKIWGGGIELGYNLLTPMVEIGLCN